VRGPGTKPAAARALAAGGYGGEKFGGIGCGMGRGGKVVGLWGRKMVDGIVVGRGNPNHPASNVFKAAAIKAKVKAGRCRLNFGRPRLDRA
jgi:hypothetical protein